MIVAFKMKLAFGHFIGTQAGEERRMTSAKSQTASSQSLTILT